MRLGFVKHLLGGYVGTSALRRSNMKNVVISLPSATRRRALMEREFERLQLQFHFHDAIDGATLSAEQRAMVDEVAARRKALYSRSPGEIACWLSHMAVLSEFACGESESMAVFEDDARLKGNLASVLEALSIDTHGFDIVKLSCRRRNFKIYKCADLLPGYSIGIINGYDLGSDGYVISRSAAKQLVDSFPKYVRPMDQLITRYWENRLAVGYMHPPVVETDESQASQISPDNYGRSSTSGVVSSRHKQPAIRKLYVKLRKSILMRIAFAELMLRFRLRVVSASCRGSLLDRTGKRFDCGH